jgi:hypothetical protein
VCWSIFKLIWRWWWRARAIIVEGNGIIVGRGTQCHHPIQEVAVPKPHAQMSSAGIEEADKKVEKMQWRPAGHSGVETLHVPES